MKKFLKTILPDFVFKAYHFWWAFFSNIRFGFPSRKLIVIGVTGTKGKSSVIEIANKILEEAGFKTAISSSLRFKIGEKEEENKFKMTMPGKGFLQKFLAKAKREGCQIALLEVTSEGIAQFRHKFIDFDIEVFLNLQPEHLERHKGFENYKKAKGQLFKDGRNAVHVLNLDDENVDYFLSFPSGGTVGFSLSKENDLRGEVDQFAIVEDRQFLPDKTIFKTNFIRGEIYSNLLGEFNLYNLLAAAIIARLVGVNDTIMKEAIKNFKGIPGRFEIFRGSDFKVILDYAHTPDSLEAALKTIKDILKPDYLVCLSGAAGGGRDKWKRPVMGKKLEKYCDKIILANEDPYDEDPQKILEDIKDGIKKKEKVLEILDRKKAIEKGVDIVKEKNNSIFAVFGKGAENSMALAGGRKISWSDKDIIVKFINK